MNTDEKGKRNCGNCRFRVGSWCTTHEQHKKRKDSCGAHGFKKELKVGM